MLCPDHSNRVVWSICSAQTTAGWSQRGDERHAAAAKRHESDALGRGAGGGAYAALCREVAAGQSPVINPYAATNPAEFFAVMSEYFFTAPEILKKSFPGVHKQLTLFYRQTSRRTLRSSTASSAQR
ncbi:MAG: zinc-dependent peptidase [Burkholderiales bacterium]